MEGFMYLRKDIFYSDIYVKGKRYRVSLKTNDRKIAMDRERTLFSFLLNQKPDKEEALLWKTFKRWFRSYLQDTKSTGTVYLYNLAIKYLEEFKKPVYLRDITPSMLLEFKFYLKEKAQNNHNKPGPAGRNRYIKLIKAMMRTAEEYGKIGICQKWALISRDKDETDGRVDFHSVEELQQIEAVLDGDLLTVFYLGWAQGLRRGEMAFLHKSDYNPTAHTLSIHKKEEWTPKTKKSARIIPLHPDTERLIKKSIARSPKSQYIINLAGNRYKNTYLSYQYIQHLGKELPFLKCYLHKLRHTFGTMLVQNGTHLKIVCDLMGHSNILQTEKYTHTTQNQFKKAIASFPHLGK